MRFGASVVRAAAQRTEQIFLRGEGSRRCGRHNSLDADKSAGFTGRYRLRFAGVREITLQTALLCPGVSEACPGKGRRVEGHGGRSNPEPTFVQCRNSPLSLSLYLQGRGDKTRRPVFQKRLLTTRRYPTQGERLG